MQIFTDASNEDWGAHLEQVSTNGLCSGKEKRLHINVLELKAVSLVLKGSRTSVKTKSVICYGQLNSSSLDVCSPVEYQIYQKWFTPHLDLFATRLNHKVPMYISPAPVQNTWDIDSLNINWSGLTAYAYPPTALLHRVIQKIRQSSCLIIVIAPGWQGMPWFWNLQLSTEIRLQLPVSTLLKQSHNYVFHSNPQHLNLHAWCLGVDSSKNKASLGSENCCPSKVINKDHL